VPPRGSGNKVVNVTVSVFEMPAAVSALILEEISNHFFVFFLWFGIGQEPQTSSHQILNLRWGQLHILWPSSCAMRMLVCHVLYFTLPANALNVGALACAVA